MTEKNKNLLKGGFFYLISNVSNMVFPFLTGLYVTRVLLPSTIGEVASAQNLAQYFVILSYLGIPTYGSREIAKARNNKKERDKVYSELLVINAFSTILFFTIYLFLILSVNQYRMCFNLYFIVGTSIALNALNNSWLFEGLEEFTYASIRNLIFKALCFVLLFVFVRDSSDFLYYAGITVVGIAGNYLSNFLYAPRFVCFSIQELNLRRHLKPIFFLVVVNLAIELYSLVDITMMGFLCEKKSIAFYKYGISIHKMLLQIINTFTMVIVPRMSLYYKEKRLKEYNVLISKGLKLIMLVSIPMIIGIIFTSGFLIQKMYGVEYSSSAIVLKCLSPLLLLSPIGYLLGSRVLLVTGHENRMIIAVGIGAVVNICGNVILIPFYKELGATMASVLSEIVVMVIYVMLGRKYFKLSSIMNTGLKTIIAGAIMAIGLYFSSLIPLGEWTVFIIQIVSAVIIYIMVLLLTREEVSLKYARIIYNKIIGRN